MKISKLLAAGLMGFVVATAGVSGAGEALAAKGGGSGGTPSAPATPTASSTPVAPAGPACATLVVTNDPQTVRNAKMPDVKYNVTNCGGRALAATVTITEFSGYFSESCPSPTAPPAPIAVPAGRWVLMGAPVYRGPCGLQAAGSTVLAPGTQAWQGHNLKLTLTDDTTGTVLSSDFFSWQDAPTRP